MTTNEGFSKTCRLCGRSQTYTSKSNYRRALANDTVCQSCANRKHDTTYDFQQLVNRLRTGERDEILSEELGLSTNALRRIRHEQDIPLQGQKRVKIKLVDEGLAECSDCGEVKPLSEFTINKVGNYTAHCNHCKYQRTKDRMNSDLQMGLRNRLRRLRNRARADGITFKLDELALYRQYDHQGGKCFYSDVELEWRIGENGQADLLSVDKVFPEQGYVTSNIVLCTRRVNLIKNDVSLNEMREWMPGWYERLERAGYV